MFVQNIQCIIWVQTLVAGGLEIVARIYLGPIGATLTTIQLAKAGELL